VGRRGGIKTGRQKNQGLFARDLLQGVEDGRKGIEKVQLAKTERVLDLPQRGGQGRFVPGKRQDGARHRVIGDEADFIIGREPAGEGVHRRDVVACNQVNSGTGFDHDENLGRRVRGGEKNDGLGEAAIEDFEVFLLEAADEFAAIIGDGSVELYDLRGHLQWLLRGGSSRVRGSMDGRPGIGNDRSDE